MSYRLAIFDFDGTLADSFPWFQRVFGLVAEEFGLRKVAAEERQTLRGCHPREAIARLGVPLWQVPRIARRIRQLKLIGRLGEAPALHVRCSAVVSDGERAFLDAPGRAAS